MHDIFIPEDYPSAWADRIYSEQYMLMAYLLGGHGNDKIIMPLSYVAYSDKFNDVMSKLNKVKHGMNSCGGFYLQRD